MNHMKSASCGRAVKALASSRLDRSNVNKHFMMSPFALGQSNIKDEHCRNTAIEASLHREAQETVNMPLVMSQM